MRSNHEHDFIREVVSCLERRSRAIKRIASAVRVADRQGRPDDSGIRSVELDLGYRVLGQVVQLHLVVWADRWLFVDARQRTKNGWAWSFTIEGRFLASEGARDFVRRIEDTVHASRASETELSERMVRIWAPFVAQGPRPA